MKTTALAILFGLFTQVSTLGGDWAQWRGPSGNGHAPVDVSPPVSWSEASGVIWKVQIPGRGHSSPTLVGNRIFLSTGDEQNEVLSVLCFSAADGKLLWKKDLISGGFPKKIHKKNTHASPTVQSNGSQLFATFFNDGGVHVIALDLDGNEQWKKKVGDFEGQYDFGYAPTPCLYKDKLIVSSEYDRGGFIAAFGQRDGSRGWKIRRGDGTSYSSPIVGKVSGKDQLLISGQNKVSSYDPDSGKRLWDVKGTTAATCGTMVWSENAVFASGGYPDKETIAVAADGSEEVLWRNNDKSYEQSMLYHDGYLYTLNDTGIAVCWDAKSGEEKWKQRLGGPVSASPILAAGNLYATNERGTCFVYKASPDGYTQLGQNQLGQEGFATPVFSGDRIYIRTATLQGNARQEWLYCVGK